MKSLKEHLEEKVLSEVLPPGWNPATGTQPAPAATPQEKQVYQQQKNPQPKPDQQAMAAYKQFQQGIQADAKKAIDQVTQELDSHIGQLKQGILQNRPNWGERMQGFRNFMGNIWDELRGVRQTQQPVVPQAPPAPQPAAYGPNYNAWYGANQPRRESVIPLGLHRSLIEHFETLKKEITLLPLREAGEQQNPAAAPYARQSWAGYQNSPAAQDAIQRGAMRQDAGDRNPLDPRDVDQLLWNFRSSVLQTMDKYIKQLSYNAMTRMDQSMRLKKPEWYDDKGNWETWKRAQDQQGQRRQPTPEEIDAANAQLQQHDYDQGGVPMDLQQSHVKHLEKTLMELNFG